MGSVSAMESINRVLEKHGEEIRKGLEEQVPASFKDVFKGVALENNLYSIGVTWEFSDGSTLKRPEIDIDTLAEEYLDCEVGY